jgi:hypothetical protein
MEELREDIDFEAELERLSENETAWLDAVTPWVGLKWSAAPLGIASLFVTAIGLILGPSGELLRFSIMVGGGSISFGVSLLLEQLSARRIAQIRSELGLTREEELRLQLLRTHKDIRLLLKETVSQRKNYFRRMAIKHLNNVVSIVDGWSYGNMALVIDYVGAQVELLKYNLKSLLLSNMIKGSEKELRQVSDILVQFMKYTFAPSVEALTELNKEINRLQYKEYRTLTRKEELKQYLYSRPRLSRLFFAAGIASGIELIALYLHLEIGVMFAVGVASFWGAFVGFDRILHLE